MRETNSYKQLRENHLSLNLNQIALHLDEVLDFGIQSGASLTEVLVKLTNHEIDIQEQQKTHRMIRSAALPSPKRLDTFDFSFQPSLNRDQIADLHSLRFIERNENVVFLGPSGVGKTHFATPDLFRPFRDGEADVDTTARLGRLLTFSLLAEHGRGHGDLS